MSNPVELPRRVVKSDVESERRLVSKQTEDGKPTSLSTAYGSTEAPKSENNDVPFQRLSRKRLSPESVSGDENRHRYLSNPFPSSDACYLSPVMASSTSIEWEGGSVDSKCASDIERAMEICRRESKAF